VIQRNELSTIKTANEVQTAIDATDGKNSNVASNLSLKRWIVVALRHLYKKKRI
jgi:hypothetical protein